MTPGINKCIHCSFQIRRLRFFGDSRLLVLGISISCLRSVCHFLKSWSVPEGVLIAHPKISFICIQFPSPALAFLILTEFLILPQLTGMSPWFPKVPVLWLEAVGLTPLRWYSLGHPYIRLPTGTYQLMLPGRVVSYRGAWAWAFLAIVVSEYWEYP